jgi:hypothetical protein
VALLLYWLAVGIDVLLFSKDCLKNSKFWGTWSTSTLCSTWFGNCGGLIANCSVEASRDNDTLCSQFKLASWVEDGGETDQALEEVSLEDILQTSAARRTWGKLNFYSMHEMFVGCTPIDYNGRVLKSWWCLNHRNCSLCCPGAVATHKGQIGCWNFLVLKLEVCPEHLRNHFAVLK